MKPQIKYFELKSGFSDNGPAWIGLASFSKTGNTFYFNGKAFRKFSGINGNYYDIETGDEYWISGVKKDMTDRHWAGGGLIHIEKQVLDDYLKIVGQSSLDKQKYEVIEIDTDNSINHFHEIENEKIEKEGFDEFLHFKVPASLSVKELRHVIEELKESERVAAYNKGRRSMKAERMLFEEELERRISE